MMAELVGGEVASAVAIKLRETFTTDELAELYKDKPEQGQTYPSAFIHIVSAKSTPLLVNRAEQSFIVDIRCNPDPLNTDSNTWAQKIIAKLQYAMEYISVSTQNVKAISMNSYQEDKVLHFIVKYVFIVVRTPVSVPSMEKLTLTERVT